MKNIDRRIQLSMVALCLCGLLWWGASCTSAPRPNEDMQSAPSTQSTQGTQSTQDAPSTQGTETTPAATDTVPGTDVETDVDVDTDPEIESETETLPDTTPVTETGVVTLPGEITGDEETQPPASPAATVLVPDFSLPGGLMTEAQSLKLALPDGTPEGAYMVYTTDGSEPTHQNGTVYRRSIPLLDTEDCTVVRAAVFGEAGDRLGHIVTMTYLRADSSTLRVISLVTDPDNLYGTSGIFTDRSESGREGERPVSVEIFEPDGEVLIRQDAAMRLAGAGSRSFDPANLRIIARKSEDLSEDATQYNGRGKFHARLFEGAVCAAYDRFLLRTGGNDSLHQANGSFLRMNMLRDAIANNACADAETLLGGTVFAQRSLPVAVYINGEYYGMLHMKQDFDENLIESMYGLPEAGISLLKGKKDGKLMYYNIEAGTDRDLADWEALCDFCADNALSAQYDEAYRRVSEQLDLENFSRYFAVMLYLCNTDWPQNNTMVWRYTPTEGDGTEGSAYADGRWRAVIRDMDLCFALHDKASQTSSTTYSMADTDTFYRITVFYRDGGYDYDASLGLYDDTMGFQGLFDFLMRSEEFRTMFREHCAILCSDAFAELCRAEVERYYALATPELPAHLALWQGRGEIYAQYTLRHFINAKQDMLDFIEDRPAYFKRYMEEALAYYD